MKANIIKLSVLVVLLISSLSVFSQDKAMISGKILSTEKEIVDFATVYLKGTSYGGTTNQEGIYHIKAPAGNYTLIVSAIGYKTVEKQVKLIAGERVKQNLTITPETQQLDEVTIVSTGVTRLKRSAFNAVAVDTKELQNTTKNLSDALTKAPGMKLRESGGVGSDMQLMLDGFSGKHTEHRGIHKAEGVCLNRKLIDTVANGGQLTHHFIELWVGLFAELIAPYHFS